MIAVPGNVSVHREEEKIEGCGELRCAKLGYFDPPRVEKRVRLDRAGRNRCCCFGRQGGPVDTLVLIWQIWAQPPTALLARFKAETFCPRHIKAY